MDTVFFTTIYPTSEKYLDTFFYSLMLQTYKDFDVLVVNDGVDNFQSYIKNYLGLNIIEFLASGSPSKNREIGINKALKLGYKYIIFGDCDDYFSDNRVSVCLDKLKDYDIVVNDLTLFNVSDVFNKKYISNRFKDNTEIHFENIKDKNFFGLSNTALNLDVIEKVDFDVDLVAVDWYFFTILLLKENRAIFTNECITFYRQYENNTVGINDTTEEAIKKGVLVKLNHYKLLQATDLRFRLLYDEMRQLLEKIKNKKYLDNLVKQIIKNPLWWENIKLL